MTGGVTAGQQSREILFQSKVSQPTFIHFDCIFPYAKANEDQVTTDNAYNPIPLSQLPKCGKHKRTPIRVCFRPAVWMETSACWSVDRLYAKGQNGDYENNG